MSTLRFDLSFNNGAERLQLPVNPDKISVNSSHGYEDIEVTQLGEYTVIGNAKLRDFSFASFFPREYNASYCEYSSSPPWEIVRMVERWMKSGKPIRFTLSGQIYGGDFAEIINEPVTIRSFNYYEEGGAVGDIYYDLALKEYAFVEFQRITSQTTVVGGEEFVELMSEVSRTDSSEKAAEYVVVSGDSLFKIAGRASIFGDSDQWRKIYDANVGIIGPNPNLITPGQTLVIPR